MQKSRANHVYSGDYQNLDFSKVNGNKKISTDVTYSGASLANIAINSSSDKATERLDSYLNRGIALHLHVI